MSLRLSIRVTLSLNYEKPTLQSLPLFSSMLGISSDFQSHILSLFNFPSHDRHDKWSTNGYYFGPTDKSKEHSRAPRRPPALMLRAPERKSLVGNREDKVSVTETQSPGLEDLGWDTSTCVSHKRFIKWLCQSALHYSWTQAGNFIPWGKANPRQGLAEHHDLVELMGGILWEGAWPPAQVTLYLFSEWRESRRESGFCRHVVQSWALTVKEIPKTWQFFFKCSNFRPL